MKILKTLALSCVLTFVTMGSHSIHAEEKELKDKKFSIGINPAGVLIPFIELQLGLMVADHVRLNIQPHFYSWYYETVNLDTFFFGGTLSGTYFIDPFKGWYFEPGVVYLSGRNTGSSESVNLLGFQFIR